jgi:hypothetical protein
MYTILGLSENVILVKSRAIHGYQNEFLEHIFIIFVILVRFSRFDQIYTPVTK